jgi:FixJ family two-component response regulator
MAMADPPVFIVDDDVSIRTALGRLLTSVGLASRAFPDPPACLAAVSSEVPGCLILDVRMPHASGLDLQSALHDRGYEIPTIFVTAHADVSLAVRLMKAGALEVFTKPFDDQALIDAVHRALSQNRQRQHDREEHQRLTERWTTLTARERDVMALVVKGLLNKQIAGALGTTEKTVKAQRAQVMHKMQAQSLVDLVRMADRLDAEHPGGPSKGIGPRSQAGQS